MQKMRRENTTATAAISVDISGFESTKNIILMVMGFLWAAKSVCWKNEENHAHEIGVVPFRKNQRTSSLSTWICMFAKKSVESIAQIPSKFASTREHAEVLNKFLEPAKECVEEEEQTQPPSFW
jgi:hypothetical protein